MLDRIGVVKKFLGRYAQRGTGRARANTCGTAGDVLAHVALDRFLDHRFVVDLGFLSRLVAETPKHPLPQAGTFPPGIERRHLDHAVRAVALAIPTTDAGVA